MLGSNLTQHIAAPTARFRCERGTPGRIRVSVCRKRHPVVPRELQWLLKAFCGDIERSWFGCVKSPCPCSLRSTASFNCHNPSDRAMYPTCTISPSPHSRAPGRPICLKDCTVSGIGPTICSIAPSLSTDVPWGSCKISAKAI